MYKNGFYTSGFLLVKLLDFKEIEDIFGYKWVIFQKRWAFVFTYESWKLGTLIFELQWVELLDSQNRHKISFC